MQIFRAGSAVVGSLLQVGAPGAGVSGKVLDGAPAPMTNVALADYGVALLMLRPISISFASGLRRRMNVRDSAKSLVFASGLMPVMALVPFVGYAVLESLLNADGALRKAASHGPDE